MGWLVGNSSLTPATVQNGIINEQVRMDYVSPVSRFFPWYLEYLWTFVEIRQLDFVNHIAPVYFSSLAQTFGETFQSSLSPEYTILYSPALKLSTQGRRSGGVFVLVRTNLLPLVCEVECKNDNTMLFSID